MALALESGAGLMNETDSGSRHVRARVRCFVSASEVPRVVANHGIESKPCDACGEPIAPGYLHYEVAFSTLTFRLDAPCFRVWAEEMLRNNPQSKTA